MNTASMNKEVAKEIISDSIRAKSGNRFKFHIQITEDKDSAISMMTLDESDSFALIIPDYYCMTAQVCEYVGHWMVELMVASTDGEDVDSSIPDYIRDAIQDDEEYAHRFLMQYIWRNKLHDIGMRETVQNIEKMLVRRGFFTADAVEAVIIKVAPANDPRVKGISALGLGVVRYSDTMTVPQMAIAVANAIAKALTMQSDDRHALVQAVARSFEECE